MIQIAGGCNGGIRGPLSNSLSKAILFDEKRIQVQILIGYPNLAEKVRLLYPLPILKEISMKIPDGYDVSSIVLEKKIISKDDFEKSNAEIEKFAKDNNMCIESTCNDMQEHIRVWELMLDIERI